MNNQKKGNIYKGQEKDKEEDNEEECHDELNQNNKELLSLNNLENDSLKKQKKNRMMDLS